MTVIALKVILAAAILSSASIFVHSAKIVVLATFSGSQYWRMHNVAEELGRRGHNVVLLAPSILKIKPSDLFKHRIYQVPFSQTDIQEEVKNFIKNGLLAVFKSEVAQYYLSTCECIINDTNLHHELQNFDLLVSDTILCGPLLSDWLDIMRVELAPISPRSYFVSGLRNIPAPPSYVPVSLSRITYRMSFLQRVENALRYGFQAVIVKYVILTPFDRLKIKYNIKPQRSIVEAAADVELVLISSDFALDYPQPLMPSTVMVGPLTITRPRPLPTNLEEFVAGSGEHGVVLVSFGTYISELDTEKVHMLAEAFGKLKQRVIWRHEGYLPSQLGDNIKTLDWLPQSDLLAHPKTRVFVTHAGHNSQTEAAYLGAPVVMIPWFGDQFDNAKKGEYFGVGLQVDHNSVTADELQRVIERVIYEPRFKQAATRISRIMSDRRRLPLEESADWIEFVIRHHGVHHLRAQVVNLSWHRLHWHETNVCY